MVLGDKYALHRSPFTGEPFAEPEWTTWDYALVHATQLIEDFTDSNGLLVWEKESDDVVVSAVKKFDAFEAAKESITSGKKYKAAKGEYFVPKLDLKYWVEEGDWPTHRSWIESQVEKETPPAPEEPTFTTG